MRIVQHVVAVALATSGLTACSSAPTTRQLAQDAVTAMGGPEKLQSIQTLVMKDGTGTRTRLGQTVRVGDQEMPGQLMKVVEIVDLANGRASLDYELRNGDFTQHRHEILTKLGEGPAGKPVGIEIVGTRPVIATAPSGLFSWGTQNSPEFLLRRNVVSILLAAAETGAETAAADKDLNGQMLKYGMAQVAIGRGCWPVFRPEHQTVDGVRGDRHGNDARGRIGSVRSCRLQSGRRDQPSAQDHDSQGRSGLFRRPIRGNRHQ